MATFRRRRIRRVLKWGGLVLSAMIVLAWLVSLRWSVTHVADTSPAFGIAADARQWELSGGYLRYDSWTKRYGFGTRIIGSIRGLFLRDATGGLGVGWPLFSGGGLGTTIHLPLWLAFMLAAIPTAILWWRDRRRIPPGHCQSCGYDLTGNVSGVCSECGTPLPPPPSAPPGGGVD